MPRVKIKRKSTRIDMTAMSDVTVLLLTFFMLTSTFVQKEPVRVNTPGSVSEIKIPETNILQILVDPNGKVFLGLDNQEDRMNVLQKVAFLALTEEQQDKMLPTLGIPCDSTDNQFKIWVKEARGQNRDLRIAIKADQTTPYPMIKGIMGTLQDLRENRYNLITSLKVVANN